MSFVRVFLGPEEPQGFFFSQFLTTNADFRRITGHSRPFNTLGEASDCDPVNGLNWFDAVELCRILSEIPEESSMGRRYRLPTVAEWEQVCRAGSVTRFFFGDSEAELLTYAWIESNDRFCPSGQFQPNPWGVFDLYGNLWEWCLNSPSDQQSNFDDLNDLHPDNLRPLCGGAWNTPARRISSSLKDWQHPSTERTTIGVRLVFTVDSVKQKPRPITTTIKSMDSCDYPLINSIGMSLTKVDLNGMNDIEKVIKACQPSDSDRSGNNEFYLGTFPVTQAEFRLLMNGGSYADEEHYSFQTDTRLVPITGVSWSQANEFCQKLSQIPAERDAGRSYELPADRVWEYCCCCGESPNAILYECTANTAWTRENTRRNTCPPVGLKDPNLWGLHDMLGGVSEWCSDYFFDYRQPIMKAIPDPYARRVVRGGNFFFPRALCQPTSRFSVSLNHTSFYVGFRVLMCIKRQ